MTCLNLVHPSLLYHFLTKITIMILIILHFFGCNFSDSQAHSKKEGRHVQKIMIAGSTSIQPIAEKLAEHYMKKNPTIKIEVQGGGSSAGIQAAKSGAAEVGMSSRELKEGEKDLFSTTIAYDAIVVIVHPKNPLFNISIEQIRKIYTTEYRNWEGLTKEKKGKITTITREDGSGTRGAFEEMVMHKTEIAEQCLVTDSTGAVREIVAGDKNGIGYISFGGLSSSVKPLAIDGVAPSMENFLIQNSGQRYKLIRPFLFLTPKEPTGIVFDFIQYIQSEEGAALLKEEGLIPKGK